MKLSLRILSYLAPLAVAAAPIHAEEWLTFEGKTGPGAGKHIVFISGDEEYRSEESMPMLAKILSQEHGFKATVLFAIGKDGVIDPGVKDNLPGAEALDSADAIVTLTRFRAWPDAQMKHFADAYERGVPVIGLRTSTHGFSGLKGTYANFNTFGKRILGEQWVNHWGRHKSEATKAIVEPGAENDPVLRSVSNIFVTTDVYEAYPAKDSTILLRGQVLKGMTPNDEPADYKKNRSTDKQEQGINDPMMPVAWKREVPNDSGKKNRTFCTTMGAANDLESESLRRLVVNAVYWGLGLDVPQKANVDLVDPYHPSNFGFKGERTGLKPEDMALGKPLEARTAEPAHK